MPLRPVALLAVIVAIALAACGDDGEPEGEPTTAEPGSRKLSSAERNLVLESESAIVSYCRKRALALTDPSKRPTVAQQARALDGVDALIELARVKPMAKLRSGVGVRLFLGDLAENLEGVNCDPAIVARLDEGLAQLESG